MKATPLLPPSSARNRLRESSLPALRGIVVVETDAEVILTGKVHSYYQKQLAQETIRPALGERRLVNRIKVIEHN
ncbi:MAG TPA: BON domain-containing protein [Gemmataceae bacterium]